jgi:hypothetical protein
VGCQASAIDRKSVYNNTSTPFAMSAGGVYSCGAWLMPSWLGTKIMAIGRDCARCPARRARRRLAGGGATNQARWRPPSITLRKPLVRWRGRERHVDLAERDRPSRVRRRCVSPRPRPPETRIPFVGREVADLEAHHDAARDDIRGTWFGANAPDGGYLGARHRRGDPIHGERQLGCRKEASRLRFIGVVPA